MTEKIIYCKASRRSNQSILKEISPECSLEGLMLKLKLQCFGHLTHWKRPWCWEGLKFGGEGDDREWDSWMASLTWQTWVWASSGSWWWTGKPAVLQSMGSQKSRTQQSILKEISPLNIHWILDITNIHWKDWSWTWTSNTLVNWCKELTHW